MSFFAKLKGDGQALPKAYGLKTIIIAGIGGFIAICVVGYLTAATQQLLVLGSFGATCVLVFGFPDVPFSQPRNIIFGHCISTLSGLCVYHFVSTEWWGMAAAAGLAIVFMMLTRTVHPPAGSNPVIVFLLKTKFSFLLFPTFTGAVLITIVALLYNNLTREPKYPKYW